MKYFLLILVSVCCIFQQCQSQTKSSNPKDTIKMNKENNPVYSRTDTSKVSISNEEWQKVLPEDIYYIARQKGTERPWTSKYEKSKEIGTYYCAACGNALFKSDTKFDSGCGWPSFYEPISKTSVIYLEDKSHGMVRTEVECGRCEAHLGHVFDDGPPPTGLRYCINGVVLDFEKAKEAEKKYNEENKK
ncbi:peptide-methionine (R)-S-oxide reductase MsrB [Niabella yanshanensis]|uniref:Peptide methionine sulfoxide reductase MsrB n=1 Tax=Niabella yanshanensis TaxID=577386 RepID=A0ABZ0W040_9BACT|nr:peptide-methionine (R)-S-oxide reductase MsrB [Niabella yanshanensis]WQD36635.1 peptide-methionine (R)-S-oxide reductase MsrB [Niabella yanshanensis]